jgi:hypothetical protein
VQRPRPLLVSRTQALLRRTQALLRSGLVGVGVAIALTWQRRSGLFVGSFYF